MALNWRPKYIALLSRLYRERVLGVATYEGYLESNREIGRQAGTTGVMVERWIMGERVPTPEQAERLVVWADRLTDDMGRSYGISEELAFYIKLDKGRV